MKRNLCLCSRPLRSSIFLKITCCWPLYFSSSSSNWLFSKKKIDECDRKGVVNVFGECCYYVADSVLGAPAEGKETLDQEHQAITTASNTLKRNSLSFMKRNSDYPRGWFLSFIWASGMNFSFKKRLVSHRIMLYRWAWICFLMIILPWKRKQLPDELFLSFRLVWLSLSQGIITRNSCPNG